MNFPRSCGRRADDEEGRISGDAVLPRDVRFGWPVLGINAYFDNSLQKLFEGSGSKVITVEGLAVRAPVGIEVNRERELHLALQFQRLRKT